MKSLQPSHCKEDNTSKEMRSNQLGARCRGELQVPEPFITKKVVARSAVVPMNTRSKAGKQVTLFVILQLLFSLFTFFSPIHDNKVLP